MGITQDTIATSVSKKLQDAVLALDEKMKGVDEDLYEKACQNTRIQTMWAFQNQLFGIATAIPKPPSKAGSRMGEDDGILSGKSPGQHFLRPLSMK